MPQRRRRHANASNPEEQFRIHLEEAMVHLHAAFLLDLNESTTARLKKVKLHVKDLYVRNGGVKH